MGKSTISMAMFNSYVTNYQKVNPYISLMLYIHLYWMVRSWLGWLQLKPAIPWLQCRNAIFMELEYSISGDERADLDTCFGLIPVNLSLSFSWSVTGDSTWLLKDGRRIERCRVAGEGHGARAMLCALRRGKVVSPAEQQTLGRNDWMTLQCRHCHEKRPLNRWIVLLMLNVMGEGSVITVHNHPIPPFSAFSTSKQFGDLRSRASKMQNIFPKKASTFLMEFL
jgi:hypothetical protein